MTIFVPKNIEPRAKELSIITAKQQAEFNQFVAQFSANLLAIQGLQGNDPPSQLFIDLLQHLTIKLDPLKYPYRLFCFNQDRQYMFEYNWKTDTFYCQYDRVWRLFKQTFHMSYQTWLQFITDQVEVYFKYGQLIMRRYGASAETHFKANPSTMSIMLPADDTVVEMNFNYGKSTTRVDVDGVIRPMPIETHFNSRP